MMDLPLYERPSLNRGTWYNKGLPSPLDHRQQYKPEESLITVEHVFVMKKVKKNLHAKLCCVHEQQCEAWHKEQDSDSRNI